ncbi:hypothetical protein LAB1_13340 [Roseibium sp. LAB1]
MVLEERLAIASVKEIHNPAKKVEDRHLDKSSSTAERKHGNKWPAHLGNKIHEEGKAASGHVGFGRFPERIYPGFKSAKERGHGASPWGLERFFTSSYAPGVKLAQ